ncbi:hypothetical protein [Nonlabens marinus]|uniref:Cell surface calcium-binding acidic-repeat protein n=1 Tax=Nonlabens marinus S1-08 TaxID=1454201 RepID=W8VQD2_9FLAO|nr:hypothetical protein [Nonlabens marinus]BAO55604.1 cell surface calcium-binding acidic-repeat protein [Nonlabens marinus S1-08]
MRKLIYVIAALAIASCDDGDIIVDNFDFEGIDVQACLPDVTEGNRTYVFYKLDNRSFESLSIRLSTTTEIFDTDGTFSDFNLNGSDKVEYRKYNSAPGTSYFCNPVPPAVPQVNDLLSSEAGQVIFTTTNQALTSNAAQTDTEPDSVDTDNDGVPSNQEPFGQDTDGDGIPDKLDFDDDGDNIPTSVEGVVNDEDEDGIPDYLDNDDDGDGILTIQEDLNGDLDPTNDTTNGIPNYLNSAVATAADPAIDNFIPHTYSRTAVVNIRIENLILTRDGQEVVFDLFDNFGTYIRPAYQVTIIPDFTEAEPNNP